MTVLRYAPTLALLAAGLLPCAAQAAARCAVDPESVKAHPVLIGDSHRLKPAHAIRVRVTVAADGTPTEAVADGEGDQDVEPTQRNALRWRYRCEGDQGGIADWEVDYPAQQCHVSISSKSMNPPRYPPEELKNRVQGTTLVGVYPRADRETARAVVLVKSSGSAALDEAAVEGAQRWQLDCTGDVDATGPGLEVPVRFWLG